jgi:hypothetical protein
MKTTILTLTAILTFTYTVLSASNPSLTKDKNITDKSEVTLSLTPEVMQSLAPVTPCEATFEDALFVSTSPVSTENFMKFSPITPDEATFEDYESDQNYEIPVRPPVIPMEASFDEAYAE